ncbi:MAG: hypothetical protein OEQ18_13080 [Gammaproteobacteria bacterium]|nr:hypothetical protein [Gammaproteobacteria bacterium]
MSSKPAAYFATCGAHAVNGGPGHGCEFFFSLTACPEELPDSLAEVAPEGNGTGHIPRSGDAKDAVWVHNRPPGTDRVPGERTKSGKPHIGQTGTDFPCQRHLLSQGPGPPCQP